MVMAQSLFITLKKRFPGCEIDVVSPEWSLPVLGRMAQVRAGIALPVRHGKFNLKKRVQIGRSLKSRLYSHAIILPRSWKSALVPYFAAVPVRTGYRGEMRYGLLNDIRVLDKAVLSRTVQRYVALAGTAADVAASPPETPAPALRADRENANRLIELLELNLDKPVIGMMPGAEYGPAKQWPPEYYSELARRLIGHGYQVWVFGSQKEEDLGRAVCGNGSGEIVNLCGKTELVDVIDLISCAEQVVTNDSGLMHVAAAVGVRVNVIYGSSTPDYTPPLSENAKIYYKNLECSPCFDRQCRYGHYDCLMQVTPDEVFQNLVPEA